MSTEQALVSVARFVANLGAPAPPTVPDPPTQKLSAFAIALVALGLVGSALVMRDPPSPTLTTLLYTVLAVLAELIVVPPRHAGWPSHLYPIATLIVVGDEPLYVVAALVLALIVRWVRRALHEDGSRIRSLRMFEVGTWLVAGAVGAVIARQISLTLLGVEWAPTLTHPATGEPIRLASALGWALSTSTVTFAMGVLGAHFAGYTWSESARLTRVRRLLGRCVLIGVVVYGIVAICDITLGSAGPAIVASSVAVGLGVLSWNALRQKERYAQLVGLAEVVEARDAATANHLRTVEDLAARVSSELGLPVSIVEDYGSAALLHDLGKLAVSSRILRKPGTLDGEEWEEMRSHATMGWGILRVLPGFSTAAAIAGHHHERWDGRGYPGGLRGVNIPLAARIVTVVDAFDAMTADRPYHRAISAHAALDELDRQRDTQFDPAVVMAFRRVVERVSYPPLWQFFPMIEE